MTSQVIKGNYSSPFIEAIEEQNLRKSLERPTSVWNYFEGRAFGQFEYLQNGGTGWQTQSNNNLNRELAQRLQSNLNISNYRFSQV